MGSPAQRSRTQTLPKQARVRKRREFLHIQNSGRRSATRHFLVVHRRDETAGPSRLGITVTRKIGNAVVRNQVKRAVRESFRACRARLSPGLAVVVIARDGAGRLDGSETAAELLPVFASVGGARAVADGMR